MTTTLMIFQAVVSILLIVVVLLQFGKGAEAGLFSGGGESIMTGSQQGNILVKITVILAILFMGNSVLLARLAGKKAGSSLLDGEAPVARPLNNDALNKKMDEAAGAKKEAPAKDMKKETTTPTSTETK